MSVDCRCVGYSCNVVCDGVAANINATCLHPPHTRKQRHPPCCEVTYRTHTHTVPAALGAVKMKLRARAVRSTAKSASAWQGPVVLAKWHWNADPADSHVTLRFCILVYFVYVKI